MMEGILLFAPAIGAVFFFVYALVLAPTGTLHRRLWALRTARLDLRNARLDWRPCWLHISAGLHEGNTLGEDGRLEG